VKNGKGRAALWLGWVSALALVLSGLGAAAVFGTGTSVSEGGGPVPKCHGLTATIVGTEEDDELHGKDEADVIVGLGGDDHIAGRKSDDVICGGPGDDRLAGGKGDDTLYGGPGRDGLKGGPGNDKLMGGPDPDKAVQ
jgi:Ca2+-binding RTX toxin-like protein